MAGLPVLGTDLVYKGDGLFLGGHRLGIADEPGPLFHKFIGTIVRQGGILCLHGSSSSPTTEMERCKKRFLHRSAIISIKDAAVLLQKVRQLTCPY